MTSAIILQATPDGAALAGARGQLAALRAALAEREAALAQVRALMSVFEGRYFREVGTLYAELDELTARIAEREVALYDSDAARERAREARAQAQESHDAAFHDEEEAGEVEPAPGLKTLFREVAKRIHPDFASDEAEQRYFTLLMVRANHAYRRGDAETLQRLLDDYGEVNTLLAEEGAAAELVRLKRQIGHVERDVSQLEAEERTLFASEIGQLYGDAAAVGREHRDLISELAAGLRQEIAEAQYRLAFIERQVTAHGR